MLFIVGVLCLSPQGWIEAQAATLTAWAQCIFNDIYYSWFASGKHEQLTWEQEQPGEQQAGLQAGSTC